MNEEILRTFGIGVFAAMAISLLLAGLLFVIVVRHMRRLHIPANAGFGETLLYTPFLVVVFIDLLDFGLDILAAPFTWIILDRLGLRALRYFAAFEAFLPFTGAIPTLTIAWFGARLLGPQAVELKS